MGTYEVGIVTGEDGAAASIVPRDFGNGHIDLAVLGNNPDTVSVLIGNGDGTFQPPVPYAVGGFSGNSMVTGDFTGDGKLDLVVSSQFFDPLGNLVNTVSIFMGNGNGTFQPAHTLFQCGSADDDAISQLLTGDFNGAARPTWPSTTRTPTS